MVDGHIFQTFEREKEALSLPLVHLKAQNVKEIMYMVRGDRVSRNACHHFCDLDRSGLVEKGGTRTGTRHECLGGHTVAIGALNLEQRSATD